MCFQVLESHQLREENEVYHGQPVFVWPDSLMALLNFKGDKRVRYYMASESREPEIVNEQNNLHRRNAYSLKKNLQDKKIGRSNLF